MGLKLITGPTIYPVTLTQAKMHLHEDGTNQDDLIELFIKACTRNAEVFTGRALIDQTWDLYLDEFPTSDIKIPKPPTIAVVGVFYIDGAGDEQEFSSASYTVDDKSEDFSWVVLNSSGSWPSTMDAINAVRVRFRAGYVDTSFSPPVGDVEFDITAAILLNLGSLYANRETVVIGQMNKLPWGAEQLLRGHRVELGMA